MLSRDDLLLLVDATYVRQRERDVYKNYILRLSAAGFPVLFSLAHLADAVGVTRQFLASASHSPSSFYRVFSIPKRSGGERRISAPLASLAEVQRWMSEEVISNFSVDEVSATAYRKNCSIKEHVFRHAGQKYLLKLDIEGFFPSINVGTISNLFSSAGYSRRLSSTMAHLLTLDGVLPQGAPSSPGISNAVMWDADVQIRQYCEKRGLVYSRYADDIAISGDEILESDSNFVKDVLARKSFSLNMKKTRLYKPDMNGRFLTGLVINGSDVRIPKETRRKIRQSVYYLNKYFAGDLLGQGDGRVLAGKFLDPIFIDRVVGQLQFWRWVEPDCTFPRNALAEILEMHGNIASLLQD